METCANYLIKANLILVLFFALYYVFFKNEPFFKVNRVLFLLAALSSATLPLLPIDHFFSTTYLSAVHAKIGLLDQIYTCLIVSTDANPTDRIINMSLNQIAENMVKMPLIQLMLWCYLFVSFLLLVKLIVHVLKLYQFLAKCGQRRINRVIYCEPKQEIASFSFFKYLVINAATYNKQEVEQIIAHEKAHINQLHSIDILLAELMYCFLWINPIAYLFKKHLKLNLEYLADEYVLQEGVNKKEYQLHLLRRCIKPATAPVINLFHASKIKHRIKMMNKSKKPHYYMLKYALTFPVIFIAHVIINYSNAQPVLFNPEKTSVKEQPLLAPVQTPETVIRDAEPSFPGGMQELLAFLKSNVVYPPAAKQHGNGDMVFASFIVDVDGTIRDVKIVKGAKTSVEFNEETLRVIDLMPKWIPAQKGGENIAAEVMLPIKFAIKG
jgi:TonB family protein